MKGGGAMATTTIGSGSDQLFLRISEDAYLADAQFTVSINGTQIGGTQTAHALHSAGQSDQLLVLGDWGAGNHTVAVNFLNDDYAGTPSADRNLYLDSATYNEASVSGASLALLHDGSKSFTF